MHETEIVDMEMERVAMYKVCKLEMGHVITSVTPIAINPDPYTFTIYEDAVDVCNELMDKSSHPYGFVVFDTDQDKIVYGSQRK